MSLASLNKLLVSLSLFACSSVFADSIITSVSFSANLTAFSPSWLSELTLSFENADQTDGVFFNPGFNDDNPGTATYNGFADLVDLDLSFAVGADGILRLEFFEGFDDFDGPDGIWNFGTITFGVETVGGEVPPGEVPEPATGLLLGAGLGMMGYASRRRQAARKAASAA